MQSVTNKLRVVHIPQVPMDGFKVEVRNEREAYLIANTLADQHLFLFNNFVIPDYSNAIFVEMYDNDSDEWVIYYNDSEGMEWDELIEVYEHYFNNTDDNE